MTRQQTTLSNLLGQMRAVTEQAETTEPLLSKQLYDILRRSDQLHTENQLEVGAQLVDRGFLPQASQAERSAKQNIDDLRRSVDRAAESVLGSETEALRFAQKELSDLASQVAKDGAARTNVTSSAAAGASPEQGQTNSLARAGGRASSPRGNASADTNAVAGASSDLTSAEGQSANEQNASGTPRHPGREGEARAENTPGNTKTTQPGGNSSEGSNTAPAESEAGRDGGADGAGRERLRQLVQQLSGGAGGLGLNGPITGNNYLDWSDRMRDVEEAVDSPELRNQLATVRERVGAYRRSFRQTGRVPSNEELQSKVLAPLALARDWVGQELSRAQNDRSLVPLDRDPVPDKFSELVRKVLRRPVHPPQCCYGGQGRFAMTSLAAIVLSGRSWLFPCLIALAALACALGWASRRNPTECWVSMLCALLKLVAVAVLVSCLLEPLWVSQRARPGANVFSLIADNSQSLQVKDDGQSRSRGEALREQLAADPQGWQAALEQSFQVRRYTFDSRLQSTRDFTDLDFDGRASALGAALRSAKDRWRGQPVAGVLLFTDGNATDLAGELPPLDGLPPVFPVVLGAESGLRDISVDKVNVSQTAFEDAPVTVQAAVTARGFAGAEIRAQLTEMATQPAMTDTNSPALSPPGFSADSNVVAALSQRAGGSESELHFRFQIHPDKPGIHFYQLEARAAEELKNAGPSREATLINNRRMVVVDRGQEPFRVLCVAGCPDWEYKFLNRALQEDPQVQMVTLMRLARREPKFSFKGRAGEGSNPLFRGFGAATNEDTARYDQPVMLRLNTKDEFELRGGFPTTAEALFKYHAVILDRVEAGFFTHEQMLLLRRFVSERGGGFLMLGGAETFREGGYAETAIASMLPVYLDRPAEAHLPSGFKLALTREGWLQPWARLRATEADEQKRLAAMPTLEVLNPIQECKPGASVLATVSDAENHTYPALVVQRFGSGSVAALMIGDLWRWGFKDEARQKDLAKSWRQLVRWLVSDVPARVSVEPQLADDPTQVRLVVKARDEEFKPLEGAVVQLTIRPVHLLAGSTETVNASAGPAELELAAEPSLVAPGSYEASYVVRQAGAYCVDAAVTQSDGQVVGRARAGWTADPAADEFRSLKPNRALLETIARRTGGQIVAINDLRDFVRRLPERGAPITETVSKPLWHYPAVFLFVLGCFVADWGIRRWKGLP